MRLARSHHQSVDREYWVRQRGGGTQGGSRSRRRRGGVDRLKARVELETRLGDLDLITPTGGLGLEPGLESRLSGQTEGRWDPRGEQEQEEERGSG